MEVDHIDCFNQRALRYGRDGNTVHLDGLGICYADPIDEALVTGEPSGGDTETGIFTTIFAVENLASPLLSTILPIVVTELSKGEMHDKAVEDHVIVGLSTGAMYDEDHLVAVAVLVIDSTNAALESSEHIVATLFVDPADTTPKTGEIGGYRTVALVVGEVK